MSGLMTSERRTFPRLAIGGRPLNGNHPPIRYGYSGLAINLAAGTYAVRSEDGRSASGVATS